MPKKLTCEEFILKSIAVHGDKYDYSKVEYINNRTKVCIICPIHGEFWQAPSKHLSHCGCPKCGNTIKRTKEDFIREARTIHGDKYDYSKVEYINNRTKVCIICPIHGEFWQTPINHINNKNGCPKCGNNMISVEEFIKRARKIHGDKYDYSKVNFVKLKDKVTIVCPIHGEFVMEAYRHLLGQRCKKCSMMKENRKSPRKCVKTVDEFIKISREIHGDKYDYSKVVQFSKSTDKVCIICPIHGEFLQRVDLHLRGCECQKCAGVYRRNCEEFIIEACKVHGDFYDYSKVEYIDSTTPVCIICPIHGEFYQAPVNHLRGSGCIECCFDSKRKSTEDFIIEARTIHGDKYDYSKVNYINSNTPVCIICPKHGEFWQSPATHLDYSGCPKCKKIDLEYFIENARMVHGDRYDYSKAEYINNHTKICIICPEHGEFWQIAGKHLIGNGCPKCKMSKLEKLVDKMLNEYSIEHISEKYFDFMGLKRCDFYLPDYKVIIECQGEQHFNEYKNNYFGDFDYTINNDIKKYNEAIEHNIRVFYYTTKKNLPSVRNVYTDEIYGGIYTEKNLYIDNVEQMIEDILSLDKIEDKSVISSRLSISHTRQCLCSECSTNSLLDSQQKTNKPIYRPVSFELF